MSSRVTLHYLAPVRIAFDSGLDASAIKSLGDLAGRIPVLHDAGKAGLNVVYKDGAWGEVTNPDCSHLECYVGVQLGTVSLLGAGADASYLSAVTPMPKHIRRCVDDFARDHYGQCGAPAVHIRHQVTHLDEK